MQRQATMLGPIAPAFMASRWFQGSREGKAFKNGSLGQGYYADDGPMEVKNLSEAISPLLASPPVTIQLCDRVVGAKMMAVKPPFTAPLPTAGGRGRRRLVSLALRLACMRLIPSGQMKDRSAKQTCGIVPRDCSQLTR